IMTLRPSSSTLFPYTTLFRSVFSNIVLIDEINRAPAKTQAALFEVMAERQVTIDGNQYDMEPPFLVFATQNPVEQEGTYRLPERSEEHTSELQSRENLVCRLL